MRASVRANPSRRRSRSSGPISSSGSCGFGRCNCDKVEMIDRFRKSETDPMPVCRIVQMRAHTTASTHSSASATTLRARSACMRSTAAMAVASSAIELPSCLRIGLLHEACDHALPAAAGSAGAPIFFKARNHPPAYEIHLEAENGILIGGRRSKRVDCQSRFRRDCVRNWLTCAGHRDEQG